MKTKRLVLTALFIALTFVFANIKIYQTISFDSLPAFLGCLVLGPVYGAIIGFLGHLFTALLSGFPFGVPAHFAIALSMSITMLVFGSLYKYLNKKISILPNLVITAIIGVLFNGPVSLLLSYPLLEPIIGVAGVFGFLPILILASITNIVIAIILFKSLERQWSKIL